MGEIADAFLEALAGKEPPRGLRSRVLVRAEDTGEAFTLSFSEGALVWKIRGSAVTAYLISDSALAIAYPSLAVNRRGAPALCLRIPS